MQAEFRPFRAGMVCLIRVPRALPWAVEWLRLRRKAQPSCGVKPKSSGCAFGARPNRHAASKPSRAIGCAALRADGRNRVRFKTVPANQTPQAMAEMIELWGRGLREKWVPPLVLAAALNLDFLCIHPFRDGNGRVSRLLFVLGCYAPASRIRLFFLIPVSGSTTIA